MTANTRWKHDSLTPESCRIAALQRVDVVGPGCVKKVLYRHRAQNAASIGALNAIFLESILRTARDAPWGASCRRCDRRKSLAQAAKASSRPATPRISSLA